MTYTAKKDIRHIGSEHGAQNRGEKMITLTSLLDEFDPAVAGEIINRIPEFTRSALDVFSGIAGKAVESNDRSEGEYRGAYRQVIESLSRQVDADDLPFEQRKYYLDRMMEAADKMAGKDTENKDHLGEFLGICAAAIAGGVVSALAVMGFRKISVGS